MTASQSDYDKQEEERKKKREELREKEQKFGIVSDAGNLIRIILGFF